MNPMILQPKTPWENFVTTWILSEAPNFDGNLEDVFQLLWQGIDQSILPKNKTMELFETYKDDLSSFVERLLNDSGQSLAMLYDRWDESDPLAFHEHNRYLILSEAFLYTAHTLHDSAIPE